MTVTVITGLCGSGKSHLAEQLATGHAVKFDEGFLATRSQRRRFWRFVRAGVPCVVVDIGFCNPARRKRFRNQIARRAGAVRLRWIFFENSLCCANWNCIHRTNKHGRNQRQKHLKINRTLTMVYRIPPGARVRSIHRIKP